jgi:hypothetical protein
MACHIQKNISDDEEYFDDQFEEEFEAKQNRAARKNAEALFRDKTQNVSGLNQLGNSQVEIAARPRSRPYQNPDHQAGFNTNKFVKPSFDGLSSAAGLTPAQYSLLQQRGLLPPTAGDKKKKKKRSIKTYNPALVPGASPNVTGSNKFMN